jgi:hypothetical protein
MTKSSFQVLSPAPREVWNEVARTDPDVLVTQTPERLDSICEYVNCRDASILYETSDGRQLIMPMVRHDRLAGGLRTQWSMPHSWGTGGIIARGAIHAEDISAILDYLVSQEAAQTCIWPNPMYAETWASARLPAGTVAIPRFSHVLDLEGGWDKVWTKRFKSTARGKVRKAERSQLSVEWDSTGRLAPVFYELYLKSVDRWAVQQHEPRLLARWRGKRRDSLQKVLHIARSSGDSCCIWVAWSDGQPAASIMVLKGKNADYHKGAMDKDLAVRTGANALLQRLAIEDACNSGCRYYHMGESGFSAPLATYKSSYGARGYHYAEYHLDRFPITRVDTYLRGSVKRLLGFKDA